jgi:hypothetical protein
VKHISKHAVRPVRFHIDGERRPSRSEGKEIHPGPSRHSSAVVWEKIVQVKDGIGLVEEASRKVTRAKRPKHQREVPHRSGSNGRCHRRV